MTVPPLTVNMSLFDGHSPERVFAAIAAAGVSRIEPSYTSGYVDVLAPDAFSDRTAAALRAQVEQYGLTCTAVSMHMDMAAADAVEAFTRRMAFSAALGAEFVLSNATSRANEPVFYANMEELAARAEALGVVIGIENPGHGDDVLFATGAEGAALCRNIGSPNVGLNFDVGNVVTYHRGARNPQDELKACLDEVVNIHAKDIRDTGRGYAFTAIGAGDVDWDAVFGHVRAAGRPLGVTIEVPLRLVREGYRSPRRADAPVPFEAAVAALQQSAAFVGTHFR